MKVPIEQAPLFIAANRQLAESARLRYMELVEQAIAEKDPDKRLDFENEAELQLSVVRAFETEAADLTRQFIAAGGKIRQVN
jgi:hypothetical protein